MIRSIFVIIITILSTLDLFGGDSVRFIVFGDSQFGNPPEYERMIYEASLLKPDFAIQVGDLINGYTHDKEKLRREWKRFKGQINLLNAPFYPVPGNHDVVTDQAEEVYAETWGKEKLLYSLDNGPAHIIVLNSWWESDDDRIMEWQRNWLKSDLEKYSEQFNKEELAKKSIFVFVHSPLWKYPDEHKGKKDWNLIHDILKQYPVKLVVGGHSHEHVWENNDGINYLIINSAGVQRENIRGGKFSAFLHVVVEENGHVEYAAIKAGSIFPLDTVNPKDRIEASKFDIKEKTILISEWNVGEPIDKQIDVEIENTLNEEIVYHLDWQIPYKADLKIIPESKWINIPPKSSIFELFTFVSSNTPPIELMPYLNITTSAKYRSGVLSRDLEDKYKSENVNIDGYTPAIKLEENFTYEGHYKLYLPPKSLVKKKSGDIKIDGVFDEKAWIEANTFCFGGKTLDEVKTEIRLLYNDDFLYVAARMEEPFPSGIHTSAEGEIPFTWNDDDIEFFFDTQKSQIDYTRLFQNAAGTRFNSLQRWVENKYFVSKYESKIAINDDNWSLEMEIPWSDIDLKKAPLSGDEWGFNIGRNRPQGMVKQFTWAGGVYNPQKYGILLFE
ncbi:MAG: metallophosphoesterase [Bacteroidetes bacterium]|nr:metallophosphoesterase [Bacteroidota bacterium]MBU1114072.1 metallophosphoesterase [Bacteroidota bacterium]MBU1798951.1 metallophosphoesterase [Bacteroidota bacterium]